MDHREHNRAAKELLGKVQLRQGDPLAIMVVEALRHRIESIKCELLTTLPENLTYQQGRAAALAELLKDMTVAQPNVPVARP